MTHWYSQLGVTPLELIAKPGLSKVRSAAAAAAAGTCQYIINWCCRIRLRINSRLDHIRSAAAAAAAEAAVVKAMYTVTFSCALCLWDWYQTECWSNQSLYFATIT